MYIYTVYGVNDNTIMGFGVYVAIENSVVLLPKLVILNDISNFCPCSSFTALPSQCRLELSHTFSFIEPFCIPWS